MNKKNKVSKIIKWVVAIVLIAFVALDIFAGNYLVTFAISRSTASGIAVAPTPTTSDDTKNTVDRVWKEISELTNNWVDSSAKEVVSISSSDGLNLVGDVFTTDANSHNWVIAIHGYTGKRQQMLVTLRKTSMWSKEPVTDRHCIWTLTSTLQKFLDL